VQRKGLLGLLLFFAAINFAFGMVSVLFTPMILSTSTADMLGTILSVAGIGMLLGSLLMSAWGGPRRKVYGVIGGLFVCGIGFFMMGISPNLVVIGAGFFLSMVTIPVANGCSQAIWQVKVEPDIQGRVFAVRRMIAQFSAPLAYLVSGPLADRIFEPALQPNGSLAASLGFMLGTGPGRGIGLMFVCMGFLTMLAVLLTQRVRSVREVELDLPDVITENLAHPSG